jgi:hypothetical protein
MSSPDADDAKRTEGGEKGQGGAKRKRPSKTIPQIGKVVERLEKEMREIYAAIGAELSPEKIREELQLQLDALWPLYVNKQLSEALDVGSHDMVAIGGSIDDDDDDDDDD